MWAWLCTISPSIMLWQPCHSINFNFYNQPSNLACLFECTCHSLPYSEVPLSGCAIPSLSFLGNCCKTRYTFSIQRVIGISRSKFFITSCLLNITELTWLWYIVIFHIMELWTMAPMDLPRAGFRKPLNLVHHGISVERN